MWQENCNEGSKHVKRVFKDEQSAVGDHDRGKPCMQVVTCNMPFNEIHFGNTNSQYRQQPLQRFCEHATSKEVIMYMYEGYFVFVNRAFSKWMANFDEPGCWIGPPTVLYTMGTACTPSSTHDLLDQKRSRNSL